jgi:hypothetical protein
MKKESLNESRRDSRPRLSSWKKPGSLLSALSEIAGMARAILREIFDESAYQRFLERSSLPSSVGAYAAFRQENDRLKSQRPRCC